MPKMRKKHRDFVELLKNNVFHVSNTCEKFGISRKTFYDWLQLVDGFEELVEQTKMQQVDMAESILYSKVVSEKDFQSIKFFLQHNHSKKYGDKATIAHTGEDGGPVELSLDSFASEWLAANINSVVNEEADDII